jgi:hypothetical protein
MRCNFKAHRLDRGIETLCLVAHFVSVVLVVKGSPLSSLDETKQTSGMQSRVCQDTLRPAILLPWQLK